jgi:hypothetical protein
MRITKAQNQKTLEMLRAIHIPEEHLALLRGDAAGWSLVDALRAAISTYIGMRANGLPVCEDGKVVQHPESDRPWERMP